MNVPKDFVENLKKGILTERMLDEALWSVNKRAKNWRDKKRKRKRVLGDAHPYVHNCEKQEKQMYERKEELLSVLPFLCVHKETAGYERTRVMDYEPGYGVAFIRELFGGNIVWIHSYTDYTTKRNVQFFDYVDKSKPKYRYYFFYRTHWHSYHTPIDEQDIPTGVQVIEIDELDTHGNDVENLVPVWFVDAVIDMMRNRQHTYIPETSPYPLLEITPPSPVKTISPEEAAETVFSIIRPYIESPQNGDSFLGDPFGMEETKKIKITCPPLTNELIERILEKGLPTPETCAEAYLEYYGADIQKWITNPSL